MFLLFLVCFPSSSAKVTTTGEALFDDVNEEALFALTDLDLDDEFGCCYRKMNNESDEKEKKNRQ